MVHIRIVVFHIYFHQSEMFGKSWTKGADYFRMDGSTSVQLRSAWSAHFNDPENYRYLLLVLLTQQ